MEESMNIMREEVKDIKRIDLMCRHIISEMKNMERINHRLDPPQKKRSVNLKRQKIPKMKHTEKKIFEKMNNASVTCEAPSSNLTV